MNIFSVVTWKVKLYSCMNDNACSKKLFPDNSVDAKNMFSAQSCVDYLWVDHLIMSSVRKIRCLLILFDPFCWPLF